MSQAEQPLSILISGAGVAGTTLALCLSRHKSLFSNHHFKYRITLLERSPAPRTTGQAIDIRGPGVQVIRQLGLEQKIKDRHTTEIGIAWVDSNGNIVARFDATGDAERQATTSEYEILRGELTKLLLEEVRSMEETDGATVNVVYGESIASLEEEDDGVNVRFANGRIENGKFDIVIAADGMSSKTRPMMFEDYAEGGVDVIKSMGLYVAFFTVPRTEADTDLWRWYNAPNGLGIHIRPHRNKTTMGVYLSICQSKRERNPEVDKVLAKGIHEQKIMLRERFQDVGWEIERLLEDMEKSDDFYMQQAALVVTPEWTSRRCALLGDSAYATMGMGTSLAMIGAYMIAGELGKLQTKDAEEISAALQSYENRLKPFVRKCQHLPPGVPQLVNPQTKIGVGILRTLLRTAYWTGLGTLLQTWIPKHKEEWKLPDY